MNTNKHILIKKLLCICCFLFVLTCSAQINIYTVTVATPDTICAGQSATVNLSGSQIGVYYGLVASTNTTAIVGGIPTAGNGSPLHFSTGTLTVTTSFAVAGATTTNTVVMVPTFVTVYVKPNPPVSASNNDTICLGSSVSLQANAPGAISYSWAPATNLSTTTGSVVTATPSVTTNYTVTETQSDGCISKAVSSVVVVTQPTVNATQTPVSCSDSCNGSVSVIAPAPNTFYFWYLPTGGSPLTSNSLTNQCAGTYTVKAYSNYCTSAAPSIKIITITSPAPLTAILDTISSTCSSGNGIIYDSTSGGTPPYTYAINGGASLTSNIITGLSAGNYTVSSMDSHGCMIKSTITISQSGNNNPVITVNSDSICAGTTATLTANGASSYTWMPATGLNTSLDSIAIASPASTTIYTITGADSLNCSGVTTCTVTVVNTNSVFCATSANGALQIHNAFSPNKDGLNDLFIIDNIEGFPNNHVYIYNRWGQLLWDKQKYNNSNVVWDGKSQDGATLYAGTYFYIIENVGPKNLKGWVEITSTIK